MSVFACTAWSHSTGLVVQGPPGKMGPTGCPGLPGSKGEKRDYGTNILSYILTIFNNFILQSYFFLHLILINKVFYRHHWKYSSTFRTDWCQFGDNFTVRNPESQVQTRIEKGTARCVFCVTKSEKQPFMSLQNTLYPCFLTMWLDQQLTYKKLLSQFLF